MTKKRSPNPWEKAPEGCEVLAAAQEARQACEELTRKLRRLRRALLACHRCEQAFNCPVRQRFKGQVDAALVEALQEWGWKGK